MKKDVEAEITVLRDIKHMIIKQNSQQQFISEKVEAISEATLIDLVNSISSTQIISCSCFLFFIFTALFMGYTIYHHHVTETLVTAGFKEQISNNVATSLKITDALEKSSETTIEFLKKSLVDIEKSLVALSNRLSQIDAQLENANLRIQHCENILSGQLTDMNKSMGVIGAKIQRCEQLLNTDHVRNLAVDSNVVDVISAVPNMF